MIDSPTVTVAADNGHKNRWAIGRFLFRQSGPKFSLNTKVLAGLGGCFVLVASTYSVLMGFQEEESRSNSTPIEFNDSLGSSKDLNVPESDGKFPQKRSTHRSIPLTGIQVIKRPRVTKIPPGSLIKARFITGASDGPTKAVLVESLHVDGEEQLPKGAVIVGRGSSSDERLNVQFSHLVLQDGSVQQIRADACDLADQTPGLRGERVSKHAALFAAGAGLNFLGGLAEGLQDTKIENGVPKKRNDLKNAALNGASTAALEQSKEVVNQWRQTKAVIRVKSGQEFYILFNGE